MKDKDTRLLEECYSSLLLGESVEMYKILLDDSVEEGRSISWYEKVIGHIDEDIAKHSKTIKYLEILKDRANNYIEDLKQSS